MLNFAVDAFSSINPGGVCTLTYSLGTEVRTNAGAMPTFAISATGDLTVSLPSATKTLNNVYYDSYSLQVIATNPAGVTTNSIQEVLILPDCSTASYTPPVPDP